MAIPRKSLTSPPPAKDTQHSSRPPTLRGSRAMMRALRRGIALVPLVWLLSAAGSLHARPAHKQALADYFGPFLAKKLNACTTCHLPDKPGDQAEGSEKPHNPFGARLKMVRDELRKAGKKTDIPSRLEAIAQEDSDGDGVSNLLE